MGFRTFRHIEHELLDEQTPERAAPSLADLVRINRMAGGHRVLRESLAHCVRPDESFTMLDVGGASGDAAEVARDLYPGARVVTLDHKLHHLSRAPRGSRVAGDAFRLPVRDRSFDIVYCGLFLHHFTNEQVAGLLRSFGIIARRYVIVNDLERHIIPYWFLPATKWIFGWDPLTLHDGPISVQAAFTASELRHLAGVAGLGNPVVRVFRPAFRLGLIAEAVRETG